jgi:hypothetical protein
MEGNDRHLSFDSAHLRNKLFSSARLVRTKHDLVTLLVAALQQPERKG